MEYIELSDKDAWKEAVREPMIQEYADVEGFNDWVKRIQEFASSVA